MPFHNLPDYYIVCPPELIYFGFIFHLNNSVCVEFASIDQQPTLEPVTRYFTLPLFKQTHPKRLANSHMERVIYVRTAYKCFIIGP